MNSKTRILEIKEAPFSGISVDLLTASEKYMHQSIELPWIAFVLPYFNDLDKALVKKIAQVWRCNIAALHLQLSIDNDEQNKYSNILKRQAARIYEQEAQRILGSIFRFENPFWKMFFIRQEQEVSKALIAMDALYYASSCRNQIVYQLLIQVLKTIIDAHYTINPTNHYTKILSLIGDLKLSKLKYWVHQQIKNILKAERTFKQIKL